MTEETNTEHQRIVKLTGLVVLLEDHTCSLAYLVKNTKEIVILVPSYRTVLDKKILPALELLMSAIEDIDELAAVIKGKKARGEIEL